jgi:hypothetical protein
MLNPSPYSHSEVTECSQNKKLSGCKIGTGTEFISKKVMLSKFSVIFVSDRFKLIFHGKEKAREKVC